MPRSVLLVVLLVLGAALPAASVAAEADAAATKKQRIAKRMRLQTFASCTGLVRYGRRFAPRGPGAGPPEPAVAFGGPISPEPIRRETGGPLPAPAPLAEEDRAGGEGESGTNVQEIGVDEPDTVKARRGHIYAVAAGRLNAVDAAGHRLLDSIDLDGFGHELLLHGERLLVIGQDERVTQSARTSLSPVPGAFDEVVALTEVDVSDPSDLRVLRTERIRGVHVGSRLTGRSARVVVWSRPRAVLEPRLAAQVHGWLPRRVLRNRVSGRSSFRRSVPCRRVLRPASFSGTDTLTVLTIDLEKGLPAVDSDAILSRGQIAYASKRSLYVATPRWTPLPEGDEAPPERATTTIHRFDISGPDNTAYRASGEVPGYLLNQFSMSEHEGVLRVASTEEPFWWPGSTDERSESRVTTLDGENGVLKSSGTWPAWGRASASTRSASSVSAATWSPSGRPTRSTRSTWRSPGTRRCAAS